MLNHYKIRFLLYKLGIRDTIPAQIINRIPIVENKEDLVDIKQDKTLFFGDKISNRNEIFLRKTVYQKLKEAQSYLPENYHFKIYSAFRSLEEQKKLWNAKYLLMHNRYPDLSEEEIVKKTRAVCADPRHGFGGHQTGGALDVSLCDAQGNDYQMGTQHSENNEKTHTKAKHLSILENKNRYILQNALTKVGFVNYPAEWWHFSYGDRMWAAYSRKKNCFYGLVPMKRGSYEN